MPSNYRRPTLSFPTLFGNFLLNERSSLYECLVAAGLPDTQKKAALSHLFHLGCLIVDGYKEVAFRADIISHSGSLPRHFGLALQLILLHDTHVALQLGKLRLKQHKRRVRLRRKRKQMGHNQSPRPLSPPLGLMPDPFISPLPDSTDDVDLPQEDLPQAELGHDLPILAAALLSFKNHWVGSANSDKTSPRRWP
jgi:hypothetical protein